MASNFLVSYDLHTPGQDYMKIIEAIKQQSDGRWAKIHLSYWYIKSEKSVTEIAEGIRRVMDINDRLIVVDATNNQAAWYRLDEEVSTYLKEGWHQ